LFVVQSLSGCLYELTVFANAHWLQHLSKMPLPPVVHSVHVIISASLSLSI